MDSQATSSFLNTMFNGLNSILGIGILSVPYALAAGGWCSLMLLLTISVSAFYTGVLMKRIMDIDPSLKTYPDIGYRAFGATGRVIILTSMSLELFLIATAFLIVEGDNLSNLFPSLHFDIHGIHVSSKMCFVMMVTVIIVPTTWLKNMRILSYISTTGVLASFIILGSMLWVGKFDGVGFQEKGKTINWDGMASAMSLYTFCYGAHPVFPTLYTSMKNKHQFSKVLLLCFILSTMIYASMAVVGYLMFGDNARSQITLNFPTTKTSSKVAIYTSLVNPIVKYALVVTPIVNTIEERFPSLKTKKLISLFIRTTLVISTTAVALTLPFFGELMSIVGALLTVTASIILPSLCYLKISDTYRVFGLELVIIGFVVLLGILIASVGTYTSIADIAKKL